MSKKSYDPLLLHIRDANTKFDLNKPKCNKCFQEQKNNEFKQIEEYKNGTSE